MVFTLLVLGIISVICLFGDFSVDFVAALLTPTIAIIAVFIAYQQWALGKAKHRQDLFDRRYEFYQIIRDFITKTCADGKVQPGADIQFNHDTADSVFLFGEDICEYVREIYVNSVALYTLEVERNGGKYSDRHIELKLWFGTQASQLPDKFRKYMGLGVE